MNIYHTDTNATLNDSKSLTTSSPAAKIRLILGLAVIATNITLVFGFTKKKQFTKTTFIFLSNLGTSDISFGFFMALGSIVMVTSQNHTQIIVICRGTTAGVVMSAIMSSICILLISIQVSIKIYLELELFHLKNKGVGRQQFFASHPLHI